MNCDSFPPRCIFIHFSTSALPTTTPSPCPWSSGCRSWRCSVLLYDPRTPGCPIHHAPCDGWDRKSSTSHNALAVPLQWRPPLSSPPEDLFCPCRLPLPLPLP